MPKSQGKPADLDPVLARALEELGLHAEDVLAWREREDHVAVLVQSRQKFKVMKGAPSTCRCSLRWRNR